MPDERDEADDAVARIAAALRPFPEVDPSAKARVLVAVAADRARERGPMARRRFPGRWTMAGVSVAAAAIFTALVLRSDGARRSPLEGVGHAETQRSAQASDAATGLAARVPAKGASLQPVQLVLRAPEAKRVSVVGDFTGWDPSRATMTRDPESGLWSVTLRLSPGRHVYAFLVDDSLWVRDPRAPVADDADFGRAGSVLLVGERQP